MAGSKSGESDMPDDGASSANDGITLRVSERVHEVAGRGTALLEDLRSRVTAIDIAVRIQERDKHAAGTLLGSALSLRLFTFFVPLVLFAVGVAGVLGRHAGLDSMSSDVGFTGSLANQIDGVFSQGATTPWLAIAAGLFGIARAGRSLTRALVLSSALSWNLGGKQKLPMRVVGVVVGSIVGVALAAAIMNRVRDAAGIAVASVSFVAVAALCVVLWSVLYLTLPRRHERPRRRPAGRNGRGGGADRTPGGHAAACRQIDGDLRTVLAVLHPRSGDGVLVRRQRSVVRTSRQCLDLRIRAPRSPTHPASVPESRPLLRSRRTRWPCMNKLGGRCGISSEPDLRCWTRGVPTGTRPQSTSFIERETTEVAGWHSDPSRSS